MPGQSTDSPAAGATGTVDVTAESPAAGATSAPAPAGGEQADAAPGGESPQEEAPERANREAARYRTALREVESERDGMAAQLDALRRAEVTRLAGQRLADGADLFRHTDTEVSGFLAEDGTVDAAKVAAAVDQLTGERPYLTGRRFLGSADQGTRTPATPPPRLGAIFSRGKG